MRWRYATGIMAGALLAACTSISFFPQISAQKTADKVIDDIWPATATGVVPTSDIETGTAAIAVIGKSIAQRLQRLKPYFDSGAVGLTAGGLLAVRDFGPIAALDRADLIALVAEDNKDRSALYREITRANRHPEWEADLRSTFGQRWISRAPSGWYYRDSAAAWIRKP